MNTKDEYGRKRVYPRHSSTLLLLAILLAVTSMRCDCDPGVTTEKRISAVYGINNETVMLTTTGGSSWQSFPNATANRDTVISGLTTQYSVAEHGYIMYAAWRVQARDATGGSSQDKVYVLALPGDWTRPVKVHEGGNNFQPSLTTHNNKLYCFWLGDGSLAWSISDNGRNWTAARYLAFPPNERLKKMDAAHHNGNQFVVAGMFTSGGKDELWFGLLNMTANGQMSWVETHEMFAGQPGPNPTLSEGVSVASNGTVVSVGFARDHRTVFTKNVNDFATWGNPFSLHDHTTAAGVVRPGTKPSLVYLDGRLYAAFMQSGAIRWRVRDTDNTWEGVQFLIDQGMSGATMATDKGVDITVNRVITSN